MSIKYKNDLDDTNETINELEYKKLKLQENLSYFRELWKWLVKFLQDKLFSTDKN